MVFNYERKGRGRRHMFDLVQDNVCCMSNHSKCPSSWTVHRLNAILERGGSLFNFAQRLMADAAAA